MKRAFLATALTLSLLETAVAAPAPKVVSAKPEKVDAGPAKAADEKLLPAGWAFLNDPSPLFPHPEKAVQEKRVSAGAASVTGTPSQATTAPTYGTSVQVPGATGLWLPLGELTPVAAFRNGQNIVLVAAGRHVLDTAGLAGIGPFRSVSSRILSDVTVIAVTLSDERDPVLRPVGAGWTLSVATDVKPQADMLLGQDANALTFMPPVAEGLPQVVALDDPDSGRRLLLGMTRSGRIQQPMRRLGTGFAVRSSLIGVVVAADSDTIELRQAGGKLILDTMGPDSFPLMASNRLQPYGSSLSGVSLGTGTPEELREALRRSVASAAMASSGDRFGARMRVAQAAARAGNGPLLGEVMDVALQDWPEGVEKPEARRLQQISAVLNARPGSSSLAEDGGSTPEDQLWRGMMRMLLPSSRRVGQSASGSPESDRLQTADLIATGLPVLQAYAAPLKERLLPLAAQWIARYGSDGATKVLDQFPDGPQVALAKALLAARRNAPDAEAKLSVLAHDPSPLIWPVAREASLRLALEKKTLPPQAVADQVDGILPALRVAEREKDGRLLQIKALMEGGNLEGAAAAVQEWGRLYPDDAARVAVQETDIIRQMARSASSGARQNMNEVAFLKDALLKASDSALRGDILDGLARRYEALGLPDQEREALRDLLASGSNAQEMNVRIRLATLELNMGDLKAARQDLGVFAEGSPDAALALPGGSSSQSVEVALLKARIALADRRPEEAVSELATIRDPRAWTLRAQMAEKAGDWPHAVEALVPMLESLPGAGGASKETLSPEQQALVLRIGGDASRAQDQQTLKNLQSRFGALMNGTPSGGVFRLLTGGGEDAAPPVSAGG
ncbi:tetratricopeptide repeat protein [Gluconobacter oxydans]|uniref:tetratricopeptide repeat protein n=1 Tax=Gluconobacter oxydans TaxID=442 RepID=UPI0039EC7B09